DNGSVKVADFGLARQYEGETGGRTTSEGVVGTPHYMSPEQVHGAVLDARSDLYSLGATWYSLLSARPLFGDAVGFEVLEKHVYETPTPISTLRPDVPPEHARLIDRMLAKEPAQRPASAREVIDELESLLGLHEATTSASSESADSHPRSIGRPVAVAALVIAGILGTTVGNHLWSF